MVSFSTHVANMIVSEGHRHLKEKMGTNIGSTVYANNKRDDSFKVAIYFGGWKRQDGHRKGFTAVTDERLEYFRLVMRSRRVDLCW